MVGKFARLERKTEISVELSTVSFPCGKFISELEKKIGKLERKNDISSEKSHGTIRVESFIIRIFGAISDDFLCVAVWYEKTENESWFEEKSYNVCGLIICTAAHVASRNIIIIIIKASENRTIIHPPHSVPSPLMFASLPRASFVLRKKHSRQKISIFFFVFLGFQWLQWREEKSYYHMKVSAFCFMRSQPSGLHCRATPFGFLRKAEEESYFSFIEFFKNFSRFRTFMGRTQRNGTIVT